MLTGARAPDNRAMIFWRTLGITSSLLLLMSAGGLASEATAVRPQATSDPAASAPAQQTDDKSPGGQAVQSDHAVTNRPAQATPPASTSPAKPTVPLQPPPANFDVQGRSREVLAHLNAVIRYYRGALPTVQTVGEPSDVLYREQALADANQIAIYAFQAGRAEALLLHEYAKRSGGISEAPAEGEAQRMQNLRTTLADRIQAIKGQQKDVETQLQYAKL